MLQQSTQVHEKITEYGEQKIAKILSETFAVIFDGRTTSII